MTTTHIEQPPPVPSDQPTTHDGAVIAPALIGICGYAGAGKDTAAAYLVERYGYERRAFADKLRDLAYQANPRLTSGPQNYRGQLREIVDTFGWDSAKRESPDVRELLQGLGQGCRSIFGDNFWVNLILPQWAFHGWAQKRIVIADVRYPNEVERIRLLGGMVVRVERPGIGPLNGHVSEHQSIRADQTVSNITGEPEVLHRALDRILQRTAGGQEVPA